MKRIALLSMVLCLLALPFSGLAVQVDLGRLSISLPAALDVFTRSMRPNDPLLAIHGTTAAEVAQDLSSQGLLMRAREIAGAYTLTLSAQAHEGPDFAALPDEELLALAAAFAGGQPDSSPILRTRQAAFALVRSGSSLTALTRVTGTLYRLSLRAEGSLSNGMADTLRQAAQSMDFGLGQ